MVGALEETGAIGEVADAVKNVTGGDRTAELFGILWIGGIGSAIVDNIPFTTAMIPVVRELQAGSGDDSYWWALSLGACFGGNATLIAAAANVAAAGLTERAGRPIGFVDVHADRHPGHDRLDAPRLRLRPGSLRGAIAESDAGLDRQIHAPGDRTARRRNADRRGGAPGGRLRTPGPTRGRGGRRRSAGIFGEREFMTALFPGYVGELASAAMVNRSIDDTIERRESCR